MPAALLFAEEPGGQWCLLGAAVPVRHDPVGLPARPVGDQFGEVVVDEVRCGAVVNAAGAWARRIGALAGVEVPVDGYRRRVAVLEAEHTELPIVTEELAGGEVLYLRGEGGRHVLAGLHSETTAEQPADPDDDVETPDRAFEARIAELVSRRLVHGAALRLRGGWAGLYPIAAGSEPIVAATEVGGFFVLAGLGGNGIQLAPALGEDLARLVLERG